MAAVTMLDSLPLNVLADPMQTRPRPFWVWEKSEFHQTSWNKADWCVWKVMKSWHPSLTTWIIHSSSRLIFLADLSLSPSWSLSTIFPAYALSLKSAPTEKLAALSFCREPSLILLGNFCKSLRPLTLKRAKVNSQGDRRSQELRSGD